MKKMLFILLGQVMVISSLSAQNDFVKAFSDKAAVSRVDFDYTYVMKEASGSGVNVTGGGQVTVQGDCYRMSGDGLEVRCDGSSVCTLDEAWKEAVIESVSECGDLLTNPAGIVKSIGSEFEWSPEGRSTVFGGVRAVEYGLSPRKSSSIKSLKLYFTASEGILKGAELITAKGTIVFTVSSLAFSPATDDLSQFSLPSLGDDYLVTDMR